MTKAFDLVIRGGTLADGLGNELREGDIAVRDGRSAAAGQFAGSGTDEIDARGKRAMRGLSSRPRKRNRRRPRNFNRWPLSRL